VRHELTTREKRSNSLWGTRRGGRGALAAFIALLALTGPVAASADPGKDRGAGNDTKAFVPESLLTAARAKPDDTFSVIVQGEGKRGSGEVASEVAEVAKDAGRGLGPTRHFATISGVAAELTGKQILKLAEKQGIVAVTVDAPVRLTGSLNSQQWPYVAGVAKLWTGASTAKLQAPTIAIVDSGIDAGRADFGGRVAAEVTMTALTPNSPGDGRGHGTFVAGIAAGGAAGYYGVAPSAKIVSLDVMDDHGMAMTSDVIAAADWIYQNGGAYGIRVANFSLHGTVATSFVFDPLDKALERLWFSGVVVVAAAGNYGVDGQPSGVPFAPGNDPFIITVGANDTAGSISCTDDFAAPWSAYGYTPDGFLKPELVAPGRYLVGPVPAGSTLALERPGSVAAPGYMQLSGTSFSAPVVAGAAAEVLAAHPGWTPDQVKGALMLAAKSTPAAARLSAGVGEVNAATALGVSDPPNPNLALNRFLLPDPAGGPTPVFDAASWSSAARADASWSSASWSSASWSSASWSSANWSSASWSSASWSSVSRASANWSSVAWADNAADDARPGGGYALDAGELRSFELELGADLDGDGAVG
jgi:serine protease AprX